MRWSEENEALEIKTLLLLGRQYKKDYYVSNFLKT